MFVLQKIVLLTVVLGNSMPTIVMDEQAPVGPKPEVTVRDQGKTSVAGTTVEPVIWQLVDTDPVPEPFYSGPIPRTAAIAEDAQLNQLCSVGDRCWAVGERGVICFSKDRGTTWQQQLLPFECSLHCVCFLTDQIGWVAGTRLSDNNASRRTAVLLQTRDGGQTWRDIAAESERSQKATAGLTRSINTPVTRIPGILHLQFFGLSDALAVTLPTSDAAISAVSDGRHSRPTLFRTRDGGATWSVVNCDQTAARWTVGAFSSLSEGLIAGEQQAHATLVSENAVTIGQPSQTLRQVRAISASVDGTAWMVGDGMFLLASTNAGVTWKAVNTGLPSRFRQIVDLRAVAHQGSSVVMAGSPSSCIIRSEDGGQTWHTSRSPLNGQIRQLLFVGPDELLAIGAFGAIARSIDAGLTWTVVRSPEYRSGLLNLVTEAESASFDLLADVTANSGLRAVVLQMSADETRPVSGNARGVSSAAGASAIAKLSPTETTVAAQHALNILGAATFDSEWMFPRNQPEHFLSADQLIAEWNRQTDGELRDLLPLRLARQIRMWKPTVIAVEPLSDEDRVAQLMVEVMPRALQIARAVPGADPVADTLSAIHLEPWTVSRVVVRCRSDASSPLRFERDTLLTSAGTQSGLLVRSATAEFTALSGTRRDVQPFSCYEVRHVDNGDPANSEVETPTSLLHGLTARIFSDARRQTLPMDSEHLKQLRLIATACRMESAALAGNIRSIGLTGAFEAELQSIGKRLPPSLALQQLVDVATLNYETGNLDGWISTQQEIIRRFPNSDDALRAATFLFRYYSSSEIRKHRLVQMHEHSAEKNRRRAPVNAAENALEQARFQKLAGGPVLDASGVPAPGQEPTDGTFPQQRLPFDSTPAGPLPSPLVPAEGVLMTPRIQQASAVTFGTAASDHEQTLLESWDRQAARALQILSTRLQSDLTSESLLRQAANFRIAGRSGDQSALLAEVASRNDDWQRYAQAESQAGRNAALPSLPVINIRKALHRPWLDASLADECWQESDEMPLSEGKNPMLSRSAGALVMMSWDDDFLYVAGRFEHQKGGPEPQRVVLNRQHDAKHAARDRFELELDLDRDYSTSFVFSIDQTGQTSERCDLLTDWDPQWFAAVESDSNTWRIELAIPLNTLDLKRTRAGDIWAMRMRRVLPGHFEQTMRLTGIVEPDTSESATAVNRRIPTTDTALIRLIRTNRKQSR
ncbi:MAG: YCF48-related protein [Planctomycetaceae bacterium]